MKLMSVLVAAGVAIGSVLMAGCSQEKKSGCGGCCGAQQKSAEKAQGGHEATGAQTAAIAQKTCPVSGQPINPKVFTEYKGEKVYFCCPGCIAKFNQGPEKYMAKLK